MGLPLAENGSSIGWKSIDHHPIVRVDPIYQLLSDLSHSLCNYCVLSYWCPPSWIAAVTPLFLFFLPLLFSCPISLDFLCSCRQPVCASVALWGYYFLFRIPFPLEDIAEGGMVLVILNWSCRPTLYEKSLRPWWHRQSMMGGGISSCGLGLRCSLCLYDEPPPVLEHIGSEWKLQWKRGPKPTSLLFHCCTVWKNTSWIQSLIYFYVSLLVFSFSFALHNLEEFKVQDLLVSTATTVLGVVI